ANEFGVKYITLYAFSTENWSRPKNEIDGLMEILVEAIHSELDSLIENGVKLETIGDTSKFPEGCLKSLEIAKEKTKENDTTTLILALNYSSRAELTDAFKSLLQEVQEGRITQDQITAETISRHLYTKNFPDPELVIRTSGEHRLSNFLLWQLAYSELHFTPVFWPEFRREHLLEALLDFQRRERRFGKTSDQVKK
ncbi:MAG: di-trans,poly-cis-decaprenylcistransferase, partial [Flavobacteriia bacterium]|nr:di-trans,poly-cis-decaprenylcistransferase [Flavobacteriia bacterium]